MSKVAGGKTRGYCKRCRVIYTWPTTNKTKLQDAFCPECATELRWISGANADRLPAATEVPIFSKYPPTLGTRD